MSFKRLDVFVEGHLKTRCLQTLGDKERIRSQTPVNTSGVPLVRVCVWKCKCGCYHERKSQLDEVDVSDMLRQPTSYCHPNYLCFTALLKSLCEVCLWCVMSQVEQALGIGSTDNERQKPNRVVLPWPKGPGQAWLILHYPCYMDFVPVFRRHLKAKNMFYRASWKLVPAVSALLIDKHLTSFQPIEQRPSQPCHYLTQKLLTLKKQHFCVCVGMPVFKVLNMMRILCMMLWRV